MKIRSYKLLFRVMSFLSDKTNGFPLFVKYKLLLGTLIIGLSASCTGNKADGNVTNEDEPDDLPVLCYDPAVPDSIGEQDGEQPDTVTEIVLPPPEPEPPFIPITCYEISCYVPAYPEPKVEYPVPDTAAIEEMPYNKIDNPPLYKGGNPEETLLSEMKKVIKYPLLAQERGIEGLVVVYFIIDEKGDVRNVNVKKPVDPSLDQEAKRAVLSLSKGWTPGYHKGKPVRTLYSFPINFKLEKEGE